MSPGDLIPLVLQLVQQFGVMLGVGSASVLLIAYLVSMRDGVVETKEAQFARVVQYVLEAGLVCIVFSGAIITVFHAMAGEYSIISSPAYFFKWALIAMVSVAVVLRRAKSFISLLAEGFVGATWYALFILHVVAPIAHWMDLLFLYAAWVAGFMLLWVSLGKIITTRVPGEAKTAVAVTAKPVSASVTLVSKASIPAPATKMQQPTPPPPQPKPEQTPPVPPIATNVSLPVPVHAVLPVKAASPAAAPVPTKPLPPIAAPAPQKPKELIVAEHISVPQKKAGDDSEIDLPHIRVMPKTPEQLEAQTRSAIVKFT